MAGEEGFEPSLTGPEPAVLPLDYSPVHLKLYHLGFSVAILAACRVWKINLG